MVVSEMFVKQVCEEYGLDVPLFKEVFNCTQKPLPYIVFHIAKEKCGVESIGEFLSVERMNDYLFEDEQEEFTMCILEKNELVVCDRSLENLGIHPSDIILCNPKNKEPENNKLMVIKVDDFVFAAMLEEYDDPQKYLIKTNGWCDDFIMSRDKFKVLGSVIGWRRANESEHREINCDK